MSDQESSGEGDGKGMCCKNCSSTTTKCGYYITFLVGLIVFVYGFIQLITADVLFLIIGSLLILCCPLWIKDFSSCFADLKNPLRLSSTIIFLAFLIGTIICKVTLNNTFLNVVLEFGISYPFLKMDKKLVFLVLKDVAVVKNKIIE